jgi:hypothetical protein
MRAGTKVAALFPKAASKPGNTLCAYTTYDVLTARKFTYRHNFNILPTH